MQDRNLQFPLMLPNGRIERRVKILLGYILGALMPGRVQQLEAGNLPEEPSRWDWLLMAGIIHRRSRNGTLSVLAPLHDWLWSGRCALVFHELAEARFETWWLKHHCEIVPPVQKIRTQLGLRRFYEIGCGSGIVLTALSKSLPEVEEFIGLDLSTAQTERNRRRFADTVRLRFETGDATEWIPANALPNSFFFTNAGVLEYLTATDLRGLLNHVAGHLAPCGFAIIEPIASGFDMDQETASIVYGSENSLCHPYPHYFREAGFEIVFQTEQEWEGMRWLLLVACLATEAPAPRPPETKSL